MAITESPFLWYNNGPKYAGLSVMLSDNIKVALVTSGYTFSAAHEFFEVSITNELTTANGYTAGGQSLTTKTIEAGVSAGEFEFHSDDPSWTASGAGLTARAFILYNDTPASSKPLLGFGYLNWNSGTPQDVTTAVPHNLSILVPATGWFYTQRINGA